MRPIIIFSILIFFMISCGKDKSENKNKLKKEITVQVLVPEKITINTKLSSLGNIIPVKEVAITPEVTGTMKKIRVEEGLKVRKGQVLGIIDQQPFKLAIKKSETAVSQAKSNLFHAESTYKESLLAMEKKFYEIQKMKIQLKQTLLELKEKQRDFKNKKVLLEKGGLAKAAFKKIELEYEETKSKYSLVKKNLATEMIGFRNEDLKRELGYVPKTKKERVEKIKQIRTRTEKAKFDIAKSAYYKSKVEHDEAKIMLKKCTLRSPLTGVVGVRKINEGEQIKRDNPVFVLFSTINVYGEFEVNEVDLGKVAIGIKATIKADAYPKKEFTGKVAIISPIVSQKTRTTMVKVKLNNKNELLRPGMFVRGTFHPKEKREVLTLPEKALLSLKGDKGEIYVVKGKYVAKKKVLVENDKYEDKVIIREGINEKDQVVIQSSSRLNEGVKVTVKNKPKNIKKPLEIPKEKIVIKPSLKKKREKERKKQVKLRKKRKKSYKKRTKRKKHYRKIVKRKKKNR